MSTATGTVSAPPPPNAENRARLAEARARAQRLFEGGATGVQIAYAVSEGVEALLGSLYAAALARFSPADQALIAEHSAMIAVGGTGRGDLAPYSDVDLLFLYDAGAERAFRDFAGQLVRDCWDAGFKLGHSIRNPAETISLAKGDPQVATALVEARLLAGSRIRFDRFQRDVYRKVFRGRARTCLEAFVESRDKERNQTGASGYELEPDLKKSLGGLRDLHLLRWVGYAFYGTADFESLRLKGALTRDEALTLINAHDFLLRLRADLHFHAGKSQDVLTRDEQLRIAEQRGIEPTPGMRPVERFMREYFRQGTAMLQVVRRFLVTHSRLPIIRRMKRSLIMHRVNGMFRAGDGHIEALPRYRAQVCSRLESILKLYCSGAMYGYVPEPSLVEQIRQNVPNLSHQLSDESASLFLRLMGCTGRLGAALRSLYECGVLELIVPSMVHARCLLQFNQYHHYTVDEHTLRTIEECERFDHDPGPIGQAYRQVRNKRILHLALLLHDLGKGFEEDHSEVGRVLAQQMAERLRLPDRDAETLVFLVHQHLKLATIALRRDLDDQKMLVALSQEIGSPETLRMLYVLTAADISGVGPGTFTGWKAELLTALYDRLMHILSGQRPAQQATDRLQRISDQVRYEFAPLGDDPDSASQREWVREQLGALPPHYVLAVPPDRILDDLRAIRKLAPGDVHVEPSYDRETECVEYRIIADSAVSDGCFYKIAGTLTAKRMEIIAAQISTTTAGTVLDTFRVVDRDFQGEVPQDRMDEVAALIRSVLTGRTDPETLFQKSRRYGGSRPPAPISDLPMKVVVGNDASDRGTIIDVFAHDRTGLLYTITRGLYDLGLSISLAKISTHFDQVVDVFYVTDANGARVTDEVRLSQVREELTHRIAAFETHGWQRFV
ncbi:MAG: [protein-PII] uridylyltransferase [Planctomycetaceae bacterium]|nr:[protein-PII] uridylyltransferase [Planctomycetaceae bacterium]